MAYYFAALPVVYFSTQFAASKAMNAAAEWATVCEELKNDSRPTIDTASAIIELYKDMGMKHPAYIPLQHLRGALDQLKYVSSKANQSKKKWRLLRKDFSKINTKIQTHCSGVEQRIRLFNEIMKSTNLCDASLQKGLKR
jgi:hypothetical protein